MSSNLIIPVHFCDGARVMEAETVNMNEDKRSVPRRHIIYYLRVFDIESGSLLGNLVDISTKGIMVVSEREVPIGETFHLKMVLPDTIQGKKAVEFEAQSRWCRNDTNPDFYDTGFELVDPQVSFLDAVDRLVEACMFKD